MTSACLVVNRQDVELFAVIHTVGKNGERDRFSFAFIVDFEGLEGDFNIPNDEIDEMRWIEASDIAKMAGGRASYQRFEELLSSHNKDFSPKFIEN
ncbi:MAG: hypothetical protein EOM38_10135 [Bacilli bacterium]|nr:hypothetical protein [Bacilli bacterium]NCU44039.1 hypothetical protein [Candidatus Saccharibacteria bacterium]